MSPATLDWKKTVTGNFIRKAIYLSVHDYYYTGIILIHIKYLTSGL
jgi:hypothetical protein